MTPQWHWTQQKNADEIKKRILESRNNNVDYCKKIHDRMTSSNNPSRIPEIRERMTQSQLASDKVPRGENHHNWKGGVVREHNKLRNSMYYKKWRSAIYEKDGWRCTDCGKHCNAGDIVAHHIKSFADCKDLRFNIDNGRTLCRSCHATVDNPQFTYKGS